MLISSDREIYHSPLIRIQNRRRVFCAGFVCLEAMQAWHGFLFKIPRDCSVLCTPAIPTHIRISWCFATLLCSCVYGSLILSAMHMQAWHGFLFKIPQDCSVLCTPAIPHTFAYRGASPHFYAHVCTGLFHIFSIRYHRIAPCFALPQSRTHSHIVVLRPTFMLMCVRVTNPVSHAHASMARLQDCAPGII